MKHSIVLFLFMFLLIGCSLSTSNLDGDGSYNESEKVFRLEEKVVFSYSVKEENITIGNTFFISPGYASVQELALDENQKSVSSKRSIIRINGDVVKSNCGDGAYSPDLKRYAILVEPETGVSRQKRVDIFDFNGNLQQQITLSPEQAGKVLYWENETSLILVGDALWKIEVDSGEMITLTDLFSPDPAKCEINLWGYTDHGCVYSRSQMSKIASLYYKPYDGQPQLLAENLNPFYGSDEVRIFDNNLYLYRKTSEDTTYAWWKYSFDEETWTKTNLIDVEVFGDELFLMVEEQDKLNNKTMPTVTNVLLPNVFPISPERIKLISSHQVVCQDYLYDFVEKELYCVQQGKRFWYASDTEKAIPNGRIFLSRSPLEGSAYCYDGFVIVEQVFVQADE